MPTIAERMTALRISPLDAARRARLPIVVVERATVSESSVDFDHLSRLRQSLGLTSAGQRLVATRTFRKEAAQRKANFVIRLVQGTMGLEAQGLRTDECRRLTRQIAGRLRSRSQELWG